MRILMISMFANHFFNWTNQLKNSGHEVYWIDVFDNGSTVDNIDWVDQTVNWKRKLDFPGRQSLKKHLPYLYKKVQTINEKSLAEIVEQKIQEIKPDVVQSFVLFSACAPILGVMKKYPDLKWIYSAWGNDLYYFQNQPNYLKDIKAVLPRINYMFADCFRDFEIAKKYGFIGKFLGVYPGGGGFEFNFEDKVYPIKERKIILVKGYQKLFGESILVLKAIQESENELKDYEIVVFGADDKCLEFIEDSGMEAKANFKVLQNIGRGDVMKLMGHSLIYIGNSISDGMPNTLLEAMIMGAFPIQSNPGGATEELLSHGKNGFLINNPMDVEEIKTLLLEAIGDKNFLEKAVMHNFQMIKPTLARKYVKDRVLEKYSYIEQSIETKRWSK